MGAGETKGDKVDKRTTIKFDRGRSPTSSIWAGNRILQRKCTCGGTSGIDGACTQCRENRLGVQPMTGSSTVPPIVHEVLSTPGQPLDARARVLMEPRFGHDFSKVRVHTGAKAAESAQAVNALAYTVGKDVVFGTGQYVPETMKGQKLLAHELTHVLQQIDTTGRLPQKISLASPTSSGEHEADAVAGKLLRASINRGDE